MSEMQLGSMSGSDPNVPPSMLSAIFLHIQSQQSLWRSIVSDLNFSPEVSDDSTLSFTSSSHESVLPNTENKFIGLLSENLNSLTVNKPFSAMFQIEDVYGRISLYATADFCMVLEDFDSGEVKCILARASSTSTVLFKRAVVSQKFENVRIVVRSDREDVRPYMKSVEIVL